jgi:hypothetical protein
MPQVPNFVRQFAKLTPKRLPFECRPATVFTEKLFEKSGIAALLNNLESCP